MTVESISGLTALLYEVRQLSRRPAQVNQHASLKRFSEALQENQAEPVQPRTLEYMDVPHSLYKCNFSAGTIILNV
jgi:hypothetical protein